MSANAKSVVITLESVTGATGLTLPAIVGTANLVPSNPNCTGAPLQCTVSATAEIGTDTFVVATYDQTQSSGTTNPAGNLLSQATLTMPIAAGNNTASRLTLAGVPATVSVAFATDAATTAHVAGSVGSGYTIVGDRPYTFTLTTEDASGATIVGPGLPTLSASSPAIALSTSDGMTYTVQAKSYSATPVTVTVSSPAGTPPTFTISTIEELWVAQYGAGNVAGYALEPNCSPACTAVDTLSSGLMSPSDLAFDTAENLWVADANANTLSEFTPPANTVIATISTGAGSNPFALAIDANHMLWEGNNAGTSVAEYGAIPLGTGADGLAFDAHGTLWIAQGASVVGYAGINPNGVRITNGIGAARGLAFDPSGNLWEADTANHLVEEFAAPLTSGSALAAAVNLGSNLLGPQGVAIDGAGTIFVSTIPDNAVRAYAASNLNAPLGGFPLIVGSTPEGIRVRP